MRKLRLMSLATAAVLAGALPAWAAGAGTAAPDSRLYVPIPWLVAMVVLLFLYLKTAAWVDREAHHFRMKEEWWNVLFVILIGAQTVLFMAAPMFIAVPAGVVAYAVMLQAFVQSRNKLVIARDKVFTRAHMEVLSRKTLAKFGFKSTQEERLTSALGERVPMALVDAEGKEVSPSDRVDRDEAVQKLKDILGQAQKDRVREVHMAPGGAGVKVLFRIDGAMHQYGEMDRNLGKAVIEKAKSLVPRLGTAGQPEEEQPAFAIDFPLIRRRVTGTVYEVEIEDRTRTVVQLRDPAYKTPGLDRLGMRTDMLAEIRRLSDENSGMIVFAGPRGSGRRTTAYAVVESVDAFTRNVGAVEKSPPLRRLANVLQQQPQDKPGEDVRGLLEAMFKQDYNMILVEGVEDPETMGYVIESSRGERMILMETGSADAGAALGALMKTGKPEALADGLRAIVSQRVVRVLCPQCRKAATPDGEMLSKLRAAAGGREVTVYEEVGCPACGNTGFAGRTGIFEFLPVKAGAKAAIAGGKTAAEVIEAARREGYVSMGHSALEKAARGLTSLREATRVLSGK